MNRNEYDRIAKDPYTWYRYGQRMEFAANKILELWQNEMKLPEAFPVNFNSRESRKAMINHYAIKDEFFPTYLMLMGYAIENITKGLDISIMIKNKDRRLQRLWADIDSTGLKDHDEKLTRLKHVSKTFQIIVSTDEEFAAKLAVDHVLWAAKYAVAKNAEETEKTLQNRLEYQKYANSLDSLYHKLEKILSRHS